MGSYPVLEVPLLSGGMVIAIIALVHVVLAHFAVGAGFLIDGFERADPRQEHPGIQRVLELLAGIFIYINFVVGAITGVGIWFAISMYSTEATAHLIGKFVWLWAIEWTFFLAEIVIGYLYYYHRSILCGRDRRVLARLYLIFTWGSLVVITGILSYMLTAQEGNALWAWANPTAWPSVFMRTISSVSIACLVMMVLVNLRALYPFDVRGAETREVFVVLYRYLRWFFLLLPFAIWFRLAIPHTPAMYAEGGSIPISMFLGLSVFFSVLVTVVAWYGYLRRRPLHLEGAFLLLCLGLGATVSAEFVREGIRKPFIIRPILYSNGVMQAEVQEYIEQSRAAGTVFAVDALYPGTDQEKTVGRWLLPPGVEAATLDSSTRGRYLVQAQCAVCHTVDGFNALRHLTRGFGNMEFGRSTIETLHISKPFMPPFIGSDRDVEDVVRYLATLKDGDAR